MNSKIFFLKKSIFLVLVAIFAVTLFFVLNCLIIHFYKIYDIWFYNFCLFLGLYEVVRSWLFRLDNALYLGSLLTYIGIFGYIFWFSNTVEYAIFYISMAFILSSLNLVVFFKQNFHLILSFIISYVTLFGILTKISLITPSIFIAFVVPFLLLLILELLLLTKRRI